MPELVTKEFSLWTSGLEGSDGMWDSLAASPGLALSLRLSDTDVEQHDSELDPVSSWDNRIARSIQRESAGLEAPRQCISWPSKMIVHGILKAWTLSQAHWRCPLSRAWRPSNSGGANMLGARGFSEKLPHKCPHKDSLHLTLLLEL